MVPIFLPMHGSISGGGGPPPTLFQFFIMALLLSASIFLSGFGVVTLMDWMDGEDTLLTVIKDKLKFVWNLLHRIY